MRIARTKLSGRSHFLVLLPLGGHRATANVVTIGRDHGDDDGLDVLALDELRHLAAELAVTLSTLTGSLAATVLATAEVGIAPSRQKDLGCTAPALDALDGSVCCLDLLGTVSVSVAHNSTLSDRTNNEV